jgi:hypothetical protein
MPMGKGTYGSKVGRPKKEKKMGSGMMKRKNAMYGGMQKKKMNKGSMMKYGMNEGGLVGEMDQAGPN